MDFSSVISCTCRDVITLRDLFMTLFQSKERTKGRGGGEGGEIPSTPGTIIISGTHHRHRHPLGIYWMSKLIPRASFLYLGYPCCAMLFQSLKNTKSPRWRRRRMRMSCWLVGAMPMLRYHLPGGQIEPITVMVSLS